MIKNTLLLGLACNLLLGANARAQTALDANCGAPAKDVRQVAMREALATAYAGNPQLEAARQELKKSEAQKIGALTGFLPSANASVQAEQYVSRQTGGIPVTVGSTVVGGQSSSYTSYPSLGLNWNLYAGGRDVAALAGAKAGVRASEQDVDRQTGATLMAVLGAYGDVLKAQSATNQQQKAINSLRALLERALQRFSQGAGSQISVDQAMLNLSQTEQDYFIGCKTLSDKSAALAQAIGARPGQSLLLRAIDPMLDADTVALDPAGFDALVEQDPAVRSALEKVEVARSKLAQARAAFKPTVALVARYDALGQSPNNFADAFSATGSTGYRIGLVLQQSLGPFTSEYAAEEVARADLAKAQAAYEGALTDVDARLRSAWNARRQATRALDAAIRLVDLSKGLVALARQNYAQGRTNLDVVEQALMTQDKQNDALEARTVEDKAAAWQLNLAANPLAFAQRLTEILGR